MYRTYQNNECKEASDIKFEEKLTPKEIKEENRKDTFSKNTPSSKKGISDDLFLILIILLLFKDDAEDNFLVIIIIALFLIQN